MQGKGKQTELTIQINDLFEYCVNREHPIQSRIEKIFPNIEPLLRTISAQELKMSHNLITNNVVVRVGIDFD